MSGGVSQLVDRNDLQLTPCTFRNPLGFVCLTWVKVGLGLNFNLISDIVTFPR